MRRLIRNLPRLNWQQLLHIRNARGALLAIHRHADLHHPGDGNSDPDFRPNCRRQSDSHGRVSWIIRVGSCTTAHDAWRPHVQVSLLATFMAYLPHVIADLAVEPLCLASWRITEMSGLQCHLASTTRRGCCEPTGTYTHRNRVRCVLRTYQSWAGLVANKWRFH